MIFRQLFDPASSTFSYLVADEGTHEAVLIDPVLEQAERDLAILAELGLTLKYTLETHVHADHVTGANALRHATGAATAVARDCRAQGYGRLLEDGDVVLFGREEILAIATPGHTPGSMCYLWRDRLFSGDTLLIGGCGRTDFQNGSAECMWESVTGKLFALDDQTLVYPGHDYKGRRVSSIAEEKQFNARFCGKTREEFLAIMANLNLAMPKRIHEAVPANLEGGWATAPGEAGTARAEPVQMLHVTPRQLQACDPASVHLLDVRTPGEFESQRVPGSVNLPLDQLRPQELLATLGAEAPLYCICQTGTRSQIAARQLRQAGFGHVVHVDGGTNAWQAAGLALERGGRKVLPLDRQVRTAAGVLVMLGVAAGALWHPAGYALSALVGAGLAYAGITNQCGMTLLFARLPWNQAREASPRRLARS